MTMPENRLFDAAEIVGAMEIKDDELRAEMESALHRKDIHAARMIVKERRAEIEARKRTLEKQLWPIEKDLHNIEEKKESLRLKIAAGEEVLEMAKVPKLQKLGETCYHKCLASWRAGEIIILGDERDFPSTLLDVLGSSPAIFVVQHDWAAAFKNAQEFTEGEFRLPYDEAVFEFRISGHRVCACMAMEDGIIASCILNIETKHGWALAGYYGVSGKDWTPALNPELLASLPIAELVRDQVRAIAIALEAEVAETEVVRAPYKLNAKRERHGKLPIFDHHIVNLAHRKRHAPRLMEVGEAAEHGHKRLHFVRGHWRHYPTHKTWIKWFFRGNPDLGFIDKEYRL